MNDQELIDRTLQGHTDAFGEIVSRYQDRLYRNLVVITGRTEDAEDVAQEAFVQAFQRLASFAGRSQFYTWLYRIAMNVWISQRRKKSALVTTQSLPGTSPLEPSDVRDDPAEPLLRAEQVDLVRRALAALPEEARTILALRELDGLDYDAIAEVIDVPIGTVRSRLHRARLQLRQELERQLET